jgi:hypothetical protein
LCGLHTWGSRPRLIICRAFGAGLDSRSHQGDRGPRRWSQFSKSTSLVARSPLGNPNPSPVTEPRSGDRQSYVDLKASSCPKEREVTL